MAQSLARVYGSYRLHPLAAITRLSVLWTLFVAGVVVALHVSTSYMIAQIWSAPPCLTAAGKGYFYVGNIVGDLLGGTAKA